jgi:hypothetical protein
MTASSSNDAPASSHPATSFSEEAEKRSVASTYPYLELLHRLQNISSTRKNADSSNDEEEDPADLKNANSPTDNTERRRRQPRPEEWDLSTDALLATLLHELSSHIQSRTHHVSSEIRSLQNSVNQVGVEIALVHQDWTKMSDNICMEQVVGDDDENNYHESEIIQEEGPEGTRTLQNGIDDDVVHNDDDSSADIARLEAEEKAAIENGMKALSLFFDPKRKSNTQHNDHDPDEISHEDKFHDNIVGISIEEDNMIGDNCYFYPAAEGDVFNQRPLPFIVGSREFMEHSCGGLVKED